MGLGIRAVEESRRRRGFRGAREALFLLRRPRAKAKFMGMNGWAGSLVRCKIICRNSVCKTMWQTMRSCTKMIFSKQPWATKTNSMVKVKKKKNARNACEHMLSADGKTLRKRSRGRIKHRQDRRVNYRQQRCQEALQQVPCLTISPASEPLHQTL
ncbi:uncharacterized protein LOC124679227 isoform X1 [Lolium rigidum]|uniref:uncharacterized protein LOC124679227 isoform X1 n=1 Tax=Lolium rigidum TaxID=89674 RepID=UPI001F5DAD4B|nr:uncharacterized protein LOC124679227 isoform X1 [Lolium rigidum]